MSGASETAGGSLSCQTQSERIREIWGEFSSLESEGVFWAPLSPALQTRAQGVRFWRVAAPLIKPCCSTRRSLDAAQVPPGTGCAGSLEMPGGKGASEQLTSATAQKIALTQMLLFWKNNARPSNWSHTFLHAVQHLCRNLVQLLSSSFHYWLHQGTVQDLASSNRPFLAR